MKTKIQKLVTNLLSRLKAVEEPVTLLDLIDQNDLLKHKELDD